MKTIKIISIIAIAIGLLGIISCNCNNEHTSKDVKKSTEYSYEHTTGGFWGSVEFGIEQRTIDSCEYIIIFGSDGRNIIHKANCNNIYHKKK
jgi:hypothetical protein